MGLGFALPSGNAICEAGSVSSRTTHGFGLCLRIGDGIPISRRGLAALAALAALGNATCEAASVSSETNQSYGIIT